MTHEKGGRVHYLVFLPDCSQTQIEATAKVCGLTHLLGGHDALPAVAGPHEQTGVMLGWMSPTNPHMHYSQGKQEWLPSLVKDDAGKPRYWCGIWKDNPPTASELRRHYTQKGPLTQFGAEKWILPTPDTVDARAVYADDGSMRWEVTRQFSWLCDEAKILTDTYVQEFGLRKVVYDSNPQAQVEWLLKLLQINYRLTPEVAAYLELWTGRDHLIDTFLRTLGMVRTGGDSNG